MGYVVCPILPRGLFDFIGDGRGAPLESSLKMALRFADAHGLNVGLVGGRVRIHVPSELHGFAMHDSIDAVRAAHRIAERYRFAVAIMSDDGVESAAILRVNPPSRGAS